jgi:hypothetical protein
MWQLFIARQTVAERLDSVLQKVARSIKTFIGVKEGCGVLSFHGDCVSYGAVLEGTIRLSEWQT